MKSATIYHAGGWPSSNWGDMCIAYAFRQHITRMAHPHTLEWRGVNYQHEPFTDTLIAEINENADVLVIGPGGAVMNQPHGPFQVQIEPEKWSDVEVPIVVQSIGWNEFPYNDSIGDVAVLEATAPIFKHMLGDSLAIHWSWRNNGSAAQLMLEPGPYDDTNKPIPLPVIHDAAFFIEPEDHELPDKGEFNVGVCWAGDRPEKRWPNGVVEMGAWMQLLQTLDWLRMYRNATVWWFCHHPDDWKDSKNHLLGWPTPATLQDAGKFASYYKQMDLVLGIRKHSVIIPYSTYTPTIGLGDQAEVRWFLEDLGEEKYLCTSKDFLRLPNLIDEILADEDWGARVYEKKRAAKSDFWGSLHQILSLAGIHGTDFRHGDENAVLPAPD